MSAVTQQMVDTSAVAALAAIRRRDVSAQDLTSRFLQRIEQGNSSLHALRHVTAEAAMEEAMTLDQRIRDGRALPPLAGLPVVIKENCDTAGVPCSAGLDFRQNYIPARDSWITARLRAAGAIVLGVAVSDPGAFSTRTAEVTHPVDPELTVGGSSGGSAAALAASFCLGAIGTDTGGSIRIPSACCGTVGLKPTFASLPMHGIFPLVRSLDHVGPMARSVEDLAIMWRVLPEAATTTPRRPQRVGYDPAWLESADPAIQEGMRIAIERLAEQNVATIEVSLPKLDDVVAMHGRIFLTEAAAYHCAHNSQHIESYPTLAKDWFAAARQLDVGAYIDACVKRAAMTEAVNEVLGSVDVILSPTLCVSRPQKAAATVMVAGVEQDFTMGLVRLTCLFDHTGHPALSVPVRGAGDSLASSVQVIAPHGAEEGALVIGEMIQSRV